MSALKEVFDKFGDFAQNLLNVPREWRMATIGGESLTFETGPLHVIIALERHGEQRWVRATLSRRDRIPNYSELTMLREDFFGQRKVIMVFAPGECLAYNQQHNLDLYCCLDGDPLPDFSKARKVAERYRSGQTSLVAAPGSSRNSACAPLKLQ